MSSTCRSVRSSHALRRAGTIRSSAVRSAAVNPPGRAVQKAVDQAEKQGCEDFLALVTSAIREADNGMEVLERVREAVSCEVAALPVPYRTTEAEPTMQSLRDPGRNGEQAFPTALDPYTCTRQELGEFAAGALALGVRYLGVCCGAGSSSSADATTPASASTMASAAPASHA